MHTIDDFIPMETNPWRIGILKNHYVAWQKKWGFDLINPSIETIMNKYWDSEICWKLNPEKYIRSLKILNEINNFLVY